MSVQTPVLSVVLRTYDHVQLVAQAIESVLLQQAPFPFELLIAEDCSTDGTRAIVEQYARRHPDLIRTVLPERNLGHGEILRRALAAAQGGYIAYLDGDDYWTSAAKLARQVDFLQRNPDFSSCFHDVSLIYDSAGFPSGDVWPRLRESRFGLSQILTECFVPAPSVVFRREVSDELPAWVFESARIDWLIYIRAAQSGSIGHLPGVLAAHRIHGGGTFSALDRIGQLEQDLRVYERLIAELPDQRDLIERCIGYRHAQLAIEQLGVPYDACVVLIDPRRELRPYFNGRHARTLPRREGHEVTELEAIRDAVLHLPPAVGDYGPREHPDARRATCYVVLPRDAAQWLYGREELNAHLSQHAQVAWQSEWATVYELVPLSDQPASERAHTTVPVEVSMLLPAAGDPCGFLDFPHSRALLPAHALAIAGWALGNGGAPQTIDFELEGELIWRAPVNVPRADVIAAFPQHAVERCGFQTTLNAQELPAGGVVQLLAAFADGSRLPLATLRVRGATDGGAPDVGVENAADTEAMQAEG